MTSRILVVDDDPPTRRLITAFFRNESIEVLEATDGESGLARVAADKPDLVLLDVHMDGMNGMECWSG